MTSTNVSASSHEFEPPSDLAELNACISKFDVTVVRTSAGKHRLYGDINRMQAVIDSPCGSLITREMHRYFVDMFDEVDAQVAECLKGKGYGVEYDPQRGIRMDNVDAPPEVVDECFYAAYDLFREPPSAEE